LWLTSLAMWSNFMRYVPPDGMPAAQADGLPANRPGLERWGYLRTTSDGLVKATRAGRYAQAAWRRLDAAINGRWSERFGVDMIGQPGTPPARRPGRRADASPGPEGSDRSQSFAGEDLAVSSALSPRSDRKIVHLSWARGSAGGAGWVWPVRSRWELQDLARFDFNSMILCCFTPL
jgi:hypothetical protein